MISLATLEDVHCSPADIQSVKVNNGRGVLLILDGWDELRPSCRLPNSFFPQLIMAEFLPECSIPITSRPGAVAHNNYQNQSC